MVKGSGGCAPRRMSSSKLHGKAGAGLEMEKVHDLSSAATRQRLEEIFYLLRLARQGR